MTVLTKLRKIIDFLEEQEEVEKVEITEVPCWASEKYCVIIFFKNDYNRPIHVSNSTSVKDFKESYKNYIKRKKDK